MIPVADFETYSEAKILDVGGWMYSVHPSTEILFLSYDMRDGIGARLWAPGLQYPHLLFEHIESGGLVEAHNSFFEFAIWENVGRARMGWPRLPLAQLRCSASRARAWGMPGKLERLGPALGLGILKDKAGHNAMLQVCKPRKPTKNKPWTRHTPENAPDLFRRTGGYCVRDTQTEVAVGNAVPELPPEELQVWLLDQRINARGVQADVPLATACAKLIQQYEAERNAYLRHVTGGAVQTAACVKELAEWAGLPNATKETISGALEDPHLTVNVRAALRVRQELSMASVKKVFAILNRADSAGRMRDLHVYCGADRTGRWAGSGVQPQNMVPGHLKIEEVEEAAGDILAGRDLSKWGPLYPLISSLTRGMICAGPGRELICSDYNAIEARVLAVLAGEEWRLEVFRTHGLIYEASASRISGVPFQEFLDYPAANDGEHHPLRKTLGKVAELASGYQGWVGAWSNFGADKFMGEEEMKRNILAWREASPSIVNLWEGLESAAVRAIHSPDTWHTYRLLSYIFTGGVLYCRLPSGRHLSYHGAKLMGNRRGEWGVSYMGQVGPGKHWRRIETYGGKLTENATQAAARDITAAALLRLDARGYPVVLHVHDEAAAEVPTGQGSVEEMEAIMEERPAWAHDWPIKASGGWRGHRYRKG